MTLDHNAIRKAYPDVITINDDKGAFDKDGNPVTLEESKINTARTTLDTEATAIAYKEKRKTEYPAIEDQLDDIYHNGIDGWKTTIKAIKDKYPKPS